MGAFQQAWRLVLLITAHIQEEGDAVENGQPDDVVPVTGGQLGKAGLPILVQPAVAQGKREEIVAGTALGAADAITVKQGVIAVTPISWS